MRLLERSRRHGGCVVGGLRLELVRQRYQLGVRARVLADSPAHAGQPLRRRAVPAALVERDRLLASLGREAPGDRAVHGHVPRLQVVGDIVRVLPGRLERRRREDAITIAQREPDPRRATQFA